MNWDKVRQNVHSIAKEVSRRRHFLCAQECWGREGRLQNAPRLSGGVVGPPLRSDWRLQPAGQKFLESSSNVSLAEAGMSPNDTFCSRKKFLESSSDALASPGPQTVSAPLTRPLAALASES